MVQNMMSDSMWISVKDGLPAKDPEMDLGDYSHFIDVLATDGKRIMVAYFVRECSERSEL